MPSFLVLKGRRPKEPVEVSVGGKENPLDRKNRGQKE